MLRIVIPDLNTPAHTRVWELLPSGTLSDLSHGCIPRNCVMVLTASSRVFMDDRAKVSSSSFSAPCNFKLNFMKFNLIIFTNTISTFTFANTIQSR